MPGIQHMIGRIQNGLNKLPLTLEGSGNTDWTNEINEMLCKLGHDFGYQVGAKGVDWSFGEWLYDVTWLEYSGDYQRSLLDVHLVAECEWGNWRSIKSDFEKLLLARARLRLMIYDSRFDPDFEPIAKRLEGYIGNFRRRHPTDVWLLAAWERNAEAWRFRYHQVGKFAEQPKMF